MADTPTPQHSIPAPVAQETPGTRLDELLAELDWSAESF